MSVELLRIDDRLVHGQVVEGWLKALRINHIVVASDNVSSDETQKALYLLAVPHGVELTCARIEDVAGAWKMGRWSAEDRVLVLLSTPQETLSLYEAGAPIKSINLGGLHFRSGRVQVLKGISLDDQDVKALKQLAAQGILLEARPLPLDEPVDIALYLQRWQDEKEAMGDQPR
jgi:mannose/fructose/N-acetylgalactosamine-specific phosphotransferase system component IIB